MRGLGFICLLLSAAFASTAFAQSEEIVVTGSRIAAYDRLALPLVTMSRRADFALVEVEVRSDTRDESQRLGELRQALRALEARARPDAVSIALLDADADYVREFSMQAAEEAFRRGARIDTSTVEILLRTPISESDTLESVRARIDRFIEAAPKPGRIEVEGRDLSLSLREPNQYRSQLVAAILADARAISQALGEGFRPEIGGLEGQVAWRRTGDLDLVLFLPYTISAAQQR